ncbi:hypothetical protein M408DRAFT_191692 [Serendipita vermifera MAFF 305830]|uniref:Glucose receptor Git3 N-terminal domain-containing protein n=1 Tax=Serendipita vermifera MAFF 305830 TaxID=933852 RepID=A0A0C3BM15_SERVB|nr:hypothetical protein M408DRAFT_191692 [Serendipita vermifera MAFF 305830]
MAAAVTFNELQPGPRGGVIFQAVIGALSTLTLLILLAHIISVSFLPICMSAINGKKLPESFPHSSSTGGSTSMDLVSMSALPDRKSSSVAPRKTSDDIASYGVDLERARAAADRRARARAREISRQKHKYDEEKLFLRMQLGIFIVCMLLSDLIQSIGVLIQARWAYLGYVEVGTACSVQAAMITFGDVATAVWNAIIACHTFATVVLGVRMSSLGIAIVVICGWLFPILMNVLGAVVVARPEHPYYTVAAGWCFIGNDYIIPRVVLHYVPLLFASLIITIMYALVSLTMRGNLQITSTTRKSCFPSFAITFRRTSVRTAASGNTNQKQVAYLRSLSLKMLWYPCVYICLILPISICRMVEINGQRAPLELLFFAMTLLFLVGLSNVAIYVSTRNVGLPSKRSPMVNSIHPPNGTQMEIYIDRVTQNDVGVVTIGGTGLGGVRDKNIRFERDESHNLEAGDSKAMDEYDVSSRSSLDKVYSYPPKDAKSPTSASHLVSTSPPTTSPPAIYHPQYSLTNPSRTQTHRLTGSVVFERLGTPPPQGRPAPFSSLPEREQPSARSHSPGANYMQSNISTHTSSPPDHSSLSYHTWEER